MAPPKMLQLKHMANTIVRRLSILIVAAVFLGLAWRQNLLVDRYAVNMMYWDQWDFYIPLFQHAGPWAVFTDQHGPHREGVGLLVTEVLAKLSGWNSRWDAFGVSYCLIAAGGLALVLARRCGVSSVLPLAAVPLLSFNIHEYETFIGPANLSHGGMPVLLLMLYCLAWFIRNARWRWLTLGALTFLLIFTGFGFFAGLLTPPLAIVEAIQASRGGERERAWLAISGLGMSAVSWALFLHDYYFLNLVPSGPASIGQILCFLSLMMDKFFGVPGFGPASVGFGMTVALVVALIGVCHARKVLLRGVAENPRSTVLFCLTTYALIYCFVTAYGRAAGNPAASRYVPLTMPAGLAIFLVLAGVGGRLQSAFLGIAYAVLLAIGTTHLQSAEMESIRFYSQGRQAWKAAYLATHDEAKADAASHFAVFPRPVPERLKYLEEHRLNLFLPDAKGGR